MGKKVVAAERITIAQIGRFPATVDDAQTKEAEGMVSKSSFYTGHSDLSKEEGA